jgi:molybdopterin-guanine dinucleotide biosynthesis protein A
MSQRIGVVLAGGKGRRLGCNKAEIELDGQSLAERAVAALWPFCASVLVSIPHDGTNPTPRFVEVRDELPAGRGPLAGIDAAFKATGEADLLVLACDYPRVDNFILRRLVWYAANPEDELVLMTDAAGRDHPLVAVWKRSMHAVVREALDREDYQVRALMPDVQVRRVGPPEFPGTDLDRALANINWPADLERIRSE